MSPAPRLGVGIWSAILALGLAAVALRLPWRALNAATIALLALAAAHAVTAVLCAAGHRWRGAAWFVQSALALGALALLGYLVVGSAVVLARLYGGLGAGLGGAIVMALATVAGPVLPLAIWGLARGGAGRRARGAVLAALAAAALAAAGATWRRAALVTGEAFAAAPPLAEMAPRPPRAGTASPGPAQCATPPGSGAATAFLTSPGGVECVQAADSAALRAAVLRRLEAVDRPAAVDEVLAVGALGSLPLAFFDGMLLRPALDGACAGARCLLPWQLVAAGVFGTSRPFAAAPDLRFGVSRAALGARLGAAPDRRLATRTTVVSADGSIHVLERTRLPAPALDAASLTAAAAGAQRYILDAQQADGRFTYVLDPFSGKSSMQGFGIPRQAGTTLVLCELGAPEARVDEAARRSLALLADSERAAERGPGERWLGPSALTLAALLACRARVGPAFDDAIAGGTRFLLAMLRPDGGFHHRFDVAAGAPRPGPYDLYAAGQAVLALVLAEKLLLTEAPPGMPPHAEVRAAVERAMTFTAERYWPGFLRPFFFLEENWHCLAARAALPHHRHDGYERFCLEYTAARRRFILGDGVDPTFAGAIGFGNLVPPQNTPAAGHGETLAAAVAVRRARGEDAAAERADLRRVLAYLLRQQWRGPECFACARPDQVAGAFSESVASATIRIDYVQHAWAALSHGARSLGE